MKIKAKRKRIVLYLGPQRVWAFPVGISFAGKVDYFRGEVFQDKEEALTWLKGQAGPLYLVISSVHLYHQRLSYPMGARPKLSQVIGFDLVEHVPHKVEDIYYTFFPMAEKNGALPVWVSYLLREQLDGLLESIKGMGKKVRGIFPGPWCLYRFLRGESKVDGAYVLKVDGCAEGVVVTPQGEMREVLPPRGDLLEKVLESLGFGYPVHFFDDEADDVGVSKAPSVDMLAKGVMASVMNPAQFVPNLGPFPMKWERKIPFRFAIYFVVPLLLLILGYSNSVRTEKMESRLNLVEQRLKKTKRALNRYEAILAEAKKKKELEDKLRGFKRGLGYNKMDVIGELTCRFPKDAWIEYLDIGKSTIRIRGEAASALELMKKLEESPDFKDVKLISSITKDRITGKERFYISVSIEEIDDTKNKKAKHKS